MTQNRHARGIQAPASRDRPTRNSLPSPLDLSHSKADDEAQSHEMDSNSRPPSYRSRPEREDDIESRAAGRTHTATTRNASTNTESTESTGTANPPARRSAAPAAQTLDKEDVEIRLATYILGVAVILAMAELCAFWVFFINFSRSMWPVKYPGIIIAVLSFGHYWVVQGCVFTLKKYPFRRDDRTIDLDRRRWGMSYMQWLYFLDIVAPFISAGVSAVVYMGLEARKKRPT